MKLVRNLAIAAAAAVVVGMVVRGSGSDEPITAAGLAEAANARLRFPVDLGDGFRLDSVVADGRAVVSTVTLLDVSAGPGDDMLKDALRTSSVSDTCRQMGGAREAYRTAGIQLVKRYLDQSGIELVAVSVSPDDCA